MEGYQIETERKMKYVGRTSFEAESLNVANVIANMATKERAVLVFQFAGWTHQPPVSSLTLRSNKGD
jgi:hypothetical protein